MLLTSSITSPTMSCQPCSRSCVCSWQRSKHKAWRPLRLLRSAFRPWSSALPATPRPPPPRQALGGTPLQWLPRVRLSLRTSCCVPISMMLLVELIQLNATDVHSMNNSSDEDLTWLWYLPKAMMHTFSYTVIYTAYTAGSGEPHAECLVSGQMWTATFGVRANCALSADVHDQTSQCSHELYLLTDLIHIKVHTLHDGNTQLAHIAVHRHTCLTKLFTWLTEGVGVV